MNLLLLLQQPPAAAAGVSQPAALHHLSLRRPLLPLLPKHHLASTVAASQLHDRYGISNGSPTMLLHAPLADQLEAMKSCCTRPLQLDRPGRPLHPRTWCNLLDGMTLYLGILHKHQGLTQPIAGEVPEPKHCRPLLSTSPTAADRHCAQGGGLHVSSAAGTACAQAAAAQLVQQSQQASGHCQQEEEPSTAHATGQVGRRPHARGTVREGKAGCTGAAAQPVASLSAEAARVVHDAALLCSMLGHLPPVRLYVLRTSAYPDYSSPCQDEACLSPGNCPGNRFTWVDTVDRSRLKVQWEHHKNARW